MVDDVETGSQVGKMKKMKTRKMRDDENDSDLDDRESGANAFANKLATISSGQNNKRS